MIIHLFILSWTPILFLTLLAAGLKRPALELSIYGALFTLLLVCLFFDTPFTVAMMAALDGAATTIPLLLVILAGILLSTLLMETGSLKRLVNWFMGGVKNAFHRNLLISLGVCNFMEGSSVIAEPVVAPMLRAAGVSPMGSAALSIIGYSGLLTLEMAGIIVTILSIVTELPIYDLALASAWLSIPATIAMAACVPLFLPDRIDTWRWLQVIACGLFLGIVTLLAVLYIGISISGMLAGLALILVFIAMGPRTLTIDRHILKDMAPFLFMLASLLIVNTIPAVKKLFFERLVFQIHIIAAHTITFRPLFSAYIYLFLAFALSLLILKPEKKEVKRIVNSGLKKGWRACVAMALFGSMGQIIAYSGYGPGFETLTESVNIPWVISNGLKIYTGTVYPLFVPFLGWVGTFLTGYGVASIMLFGQLQIQAATILNVSPVWLAAALSVGASIGSISSPFKIAIAAPMCEATGKEGEILRLTIPLGIASSLLVGLILWIFI